ncbi:NAD(P)-dependent oxidoreductase [Goodfellowiella coeruleoviolacea]|uniref:3-hydroxyisobutyrate dehydrogenase n=1 Tax=Goodfellowiella coeruleoviolacea TaxID=334858 RepID=A0AAE3GI81_9PSEU|nr:NAD(P)-dependent oxidoreductase [Goodfellowiella coeruleoviolacea]MCP2168656.1 3-hydroxyisobutyrate dehydrogenase [Goodfellowiella coeruleoviolacea]
MTTERPPERPTAVPGQPTVAVLGIGIMGHGIAGNLCRHGLPVRVWNRTRTKAEPLAELGAVVAGNPAEAVAGADVVLTVLNDGPRVLEAITSAETGLTPGTVWAQVSTVGVSAIAPLVQFAADRGLTFVDSPVQGSKPAAEQGQLVVLAAGPASARPVLEPVYRAIGERVRWVADTGETGAASRLKLVLNSWVLALTHGTAEALALAEGLGVDPADFLAVVTGGPLDNAYLRTKSRAILANDFTPTFTVTNAAKDAALVVGAAEQAGVRLDVAAAGRQRLERAAAGGHADEDMAASYFASFIH